MKSFLLAFACLLASAPTLFSQCVIDTKSQSICDCTGQINNEGSISGSIVVASNGKFQYTFPLQCPLEGGAITLTLGQVDLTIGENDQVTIPNGLFPDAGGKQFTLNGLDVDSRFVYQSTPYNNQTATGSGSFADAQDDVRRQATFLPVELQYWKVETTASGVDLLWASVMEKDNDFYALEVSYDGRNFTELTQVPGRISSDAFVPYAFHHKPERDGTVYYRLSQQDFDGTRTTFAVHSVDLGSNGSAAEVYPNPARPGDRLRFTAPATEQDVRLFRIDGREIGRLNVTRDGNAGAVDLPSDLPTGIYVLKAGTTSTRVMVR